MVRYQNLTRKPELFRAPLGPGTMYHLNPPLAGPGEDQSKCGSRWFDVVSSLQNSPTPLQIPDYAPDAYHALKKCRNFEARFLILVAAWAQNSSVTIFSDNRKQIPLLTKYLLFSVLN